MSACVLFALINGVVVGISRAINGQLSAHAGPLRASLWNHAVGFALLCILLLFLGWPHADLSRPHTLAWLGGFFGAVYVAINSFIFTRLGAMKSALLVIGGQMLFAMLLDWQQQQQAPGLLRWLGVAVLLLGLYLSTAQKNARTTPVSPETAQP